MDFQIATLLSLAETILLAGGALEGRFTLRPAELPLWDILSYFVIFFSVQYGALKFYRFVIYPHFVSPLRYLPGPKDNHPFFGQFLKILLNPSPIALHIKWHHIWPDAPFIRYFGLGNEETLVINTMEAHKEILQTHCYSFRKPEVLYRFVGEISGRGLLFSEGEEHKRLRRAMAGLFAGTSLKKISPIFQTSTAEMAAFFHRNLDNQGRTVIDSVDCFSKVALDIAGKAVMGINMNNFGGEEDPDNSFRASYRRLLQPPLLSAIISCINTAVPVRKWIPLEANRGFVRATNNLWRLTRECVDQRIADYDDAMKRGDTFQSPVLGGIGKDLLTMMVEERGKKKLQDLLTEHELVNQVLTFLAGGHETSATTMSWAAYILATRPELQEKLRADIFELVARNSGERPSPVEVDKLQSLDNFFREILRRFAPVVNTFREPIHDITICDTFIPKGTLLFFSFSLANLSKDIWGEDVEEFKPDRWNHLQGAAADTYAFETFLNGPRICVGRVFAMMELKAILVELLMSFRILPTPELTALGGEMPRLQNPSITVTPKGGVHLVLEKLG